jgi:hypothetical protein
VRGTWQLTKRSRIRILFGEPIYFSPNPDSETLLNFSTCFPDVQGPEGVTADAAGIEKMFHLRAGRRHVGAGLEERGGTSLFLLSALHEWLTATEPVQRSRTGALQQDIRRAIPVDVS